MPEPEPQDVKLKHDKPFELVEDEVTKSQKGVSWQDGIDGKSLYTVGFNALRTDFHRLFWWIVWLWIEKM